MTQQHYACNWIIRSETNYRLLAEAASKLGSRLMILKGYQKTAEGFIFNVLTINVSSQNVLNEFIETAGRNAGMADWYPISAKIFAEGEPFFEPHEDDYMHLWAKWLDTMNEAGAVNEELRQKLDSGPQT